MSKGTLKPPKQNKSWKTGIAVSGVTVLFVAIGTVLLIVGYHNEVLQWLRTTGIVFLVLSALPLLIWGYNAISRKLES